MSEKLLRLSAENNGFLGVKALSDMQLDLGHNEGAGIGVVNAVKEIDTGFYWYGAENIDYDKIAANLDE